jgi:hypothetical protein
VEAGRPLTVRRPEEFIFADPPGELLVVILAAHVYVES